MVSWPRKTSLEAINELELRNLLLRKDPPEGQVKYVIKTLLSSQLSWEEKRPFFVFLFLTGRHLTLLHVIQQVLEEKGRIPFDILIALTGQAFIKPKSIVIEALIKGLKKQNAREEVFSGRQWDRYDSRLAQMRNEMIEERVKRRNEFKENMREKFDFLKNQRMTEQAGRLLRRMIELYPEDLELAKLKEDFDEQWAREVLASHVAQLSDHKLERTLTAPSSADEEMLRMFLAEGEKLCVENRNIAADLAMAFWFMDEANRAIEILAWAPPNPSHDWLRAELLMGAGRYLEALDWVGQLEVKYINDPESTFAVSYLRAQCLHHLGQHSSALEIMQSIVRVRSNYRSAHSFILDWTSGVSWE